MSGLEDNMTKFVRIAEEVKNRPPSEVTMQIKKRVEWIRDLMIKADVLIGKGKGPSYILNRIDLMLDEIDKYK